MYPQIRLRRNRKAAWIRELVAENLLKISDLVLPLFVVEGQNKCVEISAMPGIYRRSIDLIVEIAKEAADIGIPAIALFPVINNALKDDNALEAFNPNNLISRCIKALKDSNINIGIICDVALDPYTIHGHDGIIKDGIIDNDITIEALSKQAIVLAKAGADVVAPSDMMDGRIMRVRKSLDDEGFSRINILSYAVKYASCFYTPFRSALETQDKDIDKSTYQMDFRNLNEALSEIEHDLKEGADIIMIKPGGAYLDIIYAAKKSFNTKIFAYQVSGEYAMLKFASLAGAIKWEKALIETLTAFKRAGASAIFCYAALEAAKLLKEKNHV